MAERRAIGGESRVRRESVEDMDSPRNSKSIHDRLGERVKDHENSPRKRGSRDLDRSGDEKRRRVTREEKPMPEEVVKRSKRMFGQLMGHLDAKTKEQSQRVFGLAHQRSEIRRLETTLTNTKQTAKEKIEKLERKLTMSIEYERHQARFLRTTAPIPIFYVPARHTKETQAVVDASMEAVEEKIKVRRRELEGKKREIEAEMKRKVEILEEKLQKVKESDPEKAATKGDDENNSNEENDKESKDDKTDKNDDAMGEETSDKDIAEEDNDSNNDDNDQTMEEEASVEKGKNEQDNAQEDNNDNDSTEENREDPEQVKETTSNEVAPEAIDDEPSEPKAATPEPTESPNASAQSPKAASPVAKEEVSETAAIVKTPETQPTSQSTRTPKSEIPAISKLKVVDLKKYLKERDLDTRGLKADLASRLEDALADEEE
ncbi:hypothetical protein THRCLA_00515 [Thraustotheca clavata]|uniref:SAP domain-containing protein n=1 Tax=Thraustotheca clavata TaxID=74557 RepID=A0A1W0ABC3_9STRA|nr:hypothetical protein THRCLA_00515 [Thraustotheca clavata]